MGEGNPTKEGKKIFLMSRTIEGVYRRTMRGTISRRKYGKNVSHQRTELGFPGHERLELNLIEQTTKAYTHPEKLHGSPGHRVPKIHVFRVTLSAIRYTARIRLLQVHFR